MIQKLLKYDIDPVLKRWISAFLTDRHQRVVIKGSVSSLVPVTSGVPQGSVLGPVLFLLFINDISDVVKYCSIKLYADDTFIYKAISSAQDCLLMQRDLDALLEWSRLNQMRFDVSKSFITVFSTSMRVRFNAMYHIDNSPIHQTNPAKYLGVTLQGNLHWDTHIDSVISRANRILGLIRSTLYDAP